MKSEELKNKLDELASKLIFLSKEFEEIEPLLKLNMDKVAVEEIISNCHWSAENSTVIGLHQVNEALDDNMGTGVHD